MLTQKIRCKENFVLGPATTFEQVAAEFPNATVVDFRARGEQVIYDTEAFETGGQRFTGTFRFANGKLVVAELRPDVEYPKNVSTPGARQQYRRALCDIWLSNLFGKPKCSTRDANLYDFSWGRMYSVSVAAEDKSDRGGFIAVQYR